MSTTPSSAVPSGWYPDPEGSPFQRWFDGANWGNLETGDFSAFAPSASSPAPPDFYPDPDGSPHRREWTGQAWAGFERSIPPAADAYVPPARSSGPGPEYQATPSNLPPPGMYPDPENPSQLRYWNGTAWSPPQQQHPPRRPSSSLSSRFSSSSLHLPALSFFSRFSPIQLLSGALALILVLFIGVALLKGGGTPPTSTSTTTSTKAPIVDTAFCANVHAYNVLAQANPNPGGLNTTIWSTRSEALAGLSQELVFVARQISSDATIISSAPSPDIKQAYSTNQNYNQQLRNSIIDAKITLDKQISPRTSRAQVQRALRPFERRVSTDITDAALPLPGIAQAVTAVCPDLASDTTTSTTTLPATSTTQPAL